MPWTVRKRGSRFCVIKDDDGANEGCHPTRAQAERQRRALYANEAAEMTVGELNSLIEAATLAVHEESEPPLTAVYEQVLVRMGNEGAQQFLAEQSTEAIVSAAWTPGYLLTPVLTPDERDAMERQHRQAAANYASRVLARLGQGMLSNELQIALADRSADAISDLAIEQLKKLVADAYERGLSIEDTAAYVRQQFTDLAPEQAKLLARTQIASLVNEGSMRAAQQLARTRVVYKTWQTVGDNRVRLAHANAGGQTVPINQPFTVGGFLMMYPGDFAAPAQLVYNCRCSLAFTDRLEPVSASGLTLGGIMSGSNDPQTFTQQQFQVTSPPGTSVLPIPFTVFYGGDPSNLVSSVTITVNEEEAGDEQEVTPVAWRGVLTLEKVATSDGRFFHDWSHRDLPLPLNAQTVVAEGHMGAEVAGRIDMIWKQPASEVEGLEHLGEDAVAVMGEGVLTTPFGVNEIAPMIRDQTLRGVSVDFSVEEMGLRDTETDELVSPEDVENPLELMFGSRYRPEALRSTIAMATIVGFPAFAGASLTLLASVNGENGKLVTSAYGWQLPSPEALVAAVQPPLEPPAAWFEDPLLPEPTPLTVTTEGRVFGHLAEWGKCHRGIRDACVIAPHSRSGYAQFHTGSLTTDEGDIRVGRVTVGLPHASITASKRAAMEHYDNVNSVVAFVRCGEDEHGPWLAGAVKSNASAEQIRDLKANPPSGDWREEEGALELIAALAVPVAGFPIAAISASGEEITALQMGWNQEGQIALVESDSGRTLSRADMRKIRVLTDAVIHDEPYWLRTFTQEERDRMAKNGQALPDGSFPIGNCSDAENAIRAQGRAPAAKRGSVRSHIRKRVSALGCSGDIFNPYK